MLRAEYFVLLMCFYFYVVGLLAGWNFVSPLAIHALNILLIAAASIRVAFVWRITRLWLFLIITGGALAAYSLIFLSLRDALFALSWFWTIAAYVVLFDGHMVRLKLVLPLSVFVLLAFSIYVGLGWEDIRPPQSSAGQGNTLTLLPHEAHAFRINIGPPGSSIHFTAALAGLVLVWSISRLVRGTLYKWPMFLMAFVALYLTAFSGSRAAYLGAIASVSMLAVNRRSIHPKLTWGLLAGFLSLVYLTSAIGALEQTSETVIGRLLGLDGQDITSGRQWLWAYHLAIFSDNIFGAGSGALEDLKLGETLGGEIVQASSESFFTSLLAIYGIWGVPFFALFIAPIWRAVRRNNTEMLAVATFVLIATAASSLYASVYAFLTPLLIAYFASNKGARLSDSWPQETVPADK